MNRCITVGLFENCCAYAFINIQAVRKVSAKASQAKEHFTQATVLDIVRGLLEFDSMEKMQKALEYMFACDPRLREGQPGGPYYAAAGNLARVHVMRVKDRMASPTSGGWADTMINFLFVDDSNAHLCEIQFAHERMMTDRKEGGAHHGYGIYRAAFEILESVDQLPPSELGSQHQADDLYGTADDEVPTNGFADILQSLKDEISVLRGYVDEVITLKHTVVDLQNSVAELRHENCALKNTVAELNMKIVL